MCIIMGGSEQPVYRVCHTCSVSMQLLVLDTDQDFLDALCGRHPGCH